MCNSFHSEPSANSEKLSSLSLPCLQLVVTLRLPFLVINAVRDKAANFKSESDINYPISFESSKGMKCSGRSKEMFSSTTARASPRVGSSGTVNTCYCTSFNRLLWVVLHYEYNACFRSMFNRARANSTGH